MHKNDYSFHILIGFSQCLNQAINISAIGSENVTIYQAKRVCPALELETECVSAAFVLTALRGSCENLFSVSSNSRIIKTYQ